MTPLRVLAALAWTALTTLAACESGVDPIPGGDSTPADQCAGVVCEAIDSCHTAGICDPATGECTSPERIDGTTCDDGDACTYGDHCEDGACVPAGDVVCRAVGPCNDDGVCDPATGCSTPQKPDGTACGDGDPCTTGDRCQAGVCAGEPVTCEAGDDCNEPGVCNPATGACVATPRPDGTSCASGDPSLCMTGACDGGECIATPVVCTAADDCHEAGVCDPATGECSDPQRPNGSGCDDADACTHGDSCQAGTCHGGAPVVCTPADDCHEAGSCDPATGCTSPPLPNGTACDESNPCTQTDTCQAGQCTGRDPITCTALDACHVRGVCDPATGSCTNPSIEDGAACNDGNACTLSTTCQGGVCGAGTPVSCTAVDDCHAAGSCDPASGCSNPPLDGTSCDDGDLCTRIDTCSAGTCVGSDDVTCTALDQCFEVGTCNPLTGLCSNPLELDGSACDDGDTCTQADSCQGGACAGGAPVVCAETCLGPDQVCDPGTGACVGTAVTPGTPCDDGDACTPTSSCSGGACVGSSPLQCSALDACHDAGFCDAASGTCTNPLAGAGAPCGSGPCFAEVTAVMGIEWTNPPAPGAAPHLGAGAAFLDYDGDGWLDLVFAGEGGSLALYLNRNGIDFEERTVAAGLPDNLPPGALMGATAADYDNDGHRDLLLITTRGNILFHNDGTSFTNVTEDAGLLQDRWGTSASFADFDNDGLLDLYVGNYIAQLGGTVPAANTLYRNDGDGTFTDVTAAYGVAGAGTTLAVLWSDYDGDGWIDLFVCNAYGGAREANRVYRNMGAGSPAPGSWLVERSASIGADLAAHCQGIAAGDYDGDGDLDYLLSTIGANTLLRNDGASGFVDRAAAAGVEADADACTTQPTASWAAAFADLDADGHLDLYVVNGDNPEVGAPPSSADEANLLFHHDGATATYTEIGLAAGLADPRRGRGAALGDYDNDGDLDIVLVNVDGSPVLYRNDTAGGASIQVELEGRLSNRDGIGARATATVGGAPIVREVSAATGTFSLSEHRLHFGTGAAVSASQLTVAWPSGVTQRLLDVPAPSAFTLIEPYAVVAGAAVGTSPVSEGSSIALDFDIDNHAGTGVSATYTTVVHVTGRPSLTGPGATVIVGAGATSPISVAIPVPTGAAGGATRNAVAVITVTDAGGGYDQAAVSLQIAP